MTTQQWWQRDGKKQHEQNIAELVETFGDTISPEEIRRLYNESLSQHKDDLQLFLAILVKRQVREQLSQKKTPDSEPSDATISHEALSGGAHFEKNR